MKLYSISGKKSTSLLDNICRFLSHQFVTLYLKSISKAKIVKFFCPRMSEHMIYIKNVTNVIKTLHQNVTNMTDIASKEIPTMEFYTIDKYLKLFVMLSIICVLLNTEFITLQWIFTWSHFGAVTIFVRSHKRDQSLHGLSSWPWWRIYLFKDLYVLTSTRSTIINQETCW